MKRTSPTDSAVTYPKMRTRSTSNQLSITLSRWRRSSFNLTASKMIPIKICWIRWTSRIPARTSSRTCSSLRMSTFSLWGKIVVSTTPISPLNSKERGQEETRPWPWSLTAKKMKLSQSSQKTIPSRRSRKWKNSSLMKITRRLREALVWIEARSRCPTASRQTTSSSSMKTTLGRKSSTTPGTRLERWKHPRTYDSQVSAHTQENT